MSTNNSAQGEMEAVDLYRLAVEQYREHPRIYWARNRFFATLQTALLAFATFSVRDASEITIADVVLAVSGLLLAAVWYKVMLVSSSLMTIWRNIILDLEEELFQSDEPLNLQRFKRGIFQRAADAGEAASAKFSITRLILIMIAIFFAAWSALLLYFASRVTLQFWPQVAG